MAFYKDVNSQTPTDRPDVTDTQSVFQSLRNLLNTRKGERAFDPFYGVDIEDKLFDLMGDATELEILSDVFDAVDTYEKRVLLKKGISSVELYPDDNQVDVTLVFNIEGIEDKLFTLTETFTG